MSQHRWHRRQSRLRCETTASQVRQPARNTTDFDEITSVENLAAAFKWVRSYGGEAVGPDQIRLADVAMNDVWDLVRAVSPSLQDHSYRPGDTRWVRILKNPSDPHAPRRYRHIQIPRLVDRIVSCALQQAIGPVIERDLLGGCYGFSGRGPLALLAHLDHDIRHTGFCWLVNDDVTGAFDNVPKQLVIDCHRDLITDPRLMRLLESVIQGHEANPTGISQGGATSPCSYTRTMHVIHDLAMQRSQTPHWYRYADNHTYLCPCEATARSTRRRAQEILGAHGLMLKFTEAEAIINLRERSTELLGFSITIQSDGIHLGVEEKAWIELATKLDRAQADPRPLTVANQICIGWAKAYGAAIVDPTGAARRITALLQQTYLGGAVSPAELVDSFLRGAQQWDDLRKQVPTACNETVYDEEGCLRRPQPRAEIARNVSYIRVYLPPGVDRGEVPFDLSDSLSDDI